MKGLLEYDRGDKVYSNIIHIVEGKRAPENHRIIRIHFEYVVQPYHTCSRIHN